MIFGLGPPKNLQKINFQLILLILAFFVDFWGFGRGRVGLGAAQQVWAGLVGVGWWGWGGGWRRPTGLGGVGQVWAGLAGGTLNPKGGGIR